MAYHKLEAPQTLLRLERRPIMCPRCSGTLIQEPGASRCRLCGRIFRLIGDERAQREFERASGLQSAQERTLPVDSLTRFDHGGRHRHRSLE